MKLTNGKEKVPPCASRPASFQLREHVRDKFIQPGFGFRTVERPAKIVGLRFAEGLYAAALDLRP
jgi:hypothetical protein